MVTERNVSRALLLLALLLVRVIDAKSQADCAYGYRIHIRDETGKVVSNAKVDVAGSSEQDKLPAAFQNIFARGTYFIGFVMYGCAYPGQFVLRVSAVGLQKYERHITFTEGLVACELVLPPEGSAKNASFEKLATLWGKVADQKGQPFSGAQIEAVNANGRVYRAESGEQGNYQLDLPKGLNTIRFTNSNIKPVIIEQYRVETNDTLDVNVCRECKSHI